MAARAQPVRCDLHAVVGVTRRSVSRDLRKDRRPTGDGVPALFDHEHPCTFAEDEAITIERERPRGLCGIVPVARRDDAHALESRQDAARDWRIGPPATIDVMTPARMSIAAYPIASVLLVQPVDNKCDGPRNFSAIESSLDRLPCVPEVME
jgi:hypothetical protein